MYTVRIHASSYIFKLVKIMQNKKVTIVTYTKKASKPISQFLYRLSDPYHLSNSTYPPAQASSFKALVYMVFHLISRTTICIATNIGKLLPHLLTLTSTRKAVIFFFGTIPSRTSPISGEQCSVMSGLSYVYLCKHR